MDSLDALRQDALQHSGTLGLTKREGEVLTQRADGRSIAEIARVLAVEPRTVKFHLQNIYTKLGTRERSQVARQLALTRYAHARDRSAGDDVCGTPALRPAAPSSVLFRPDRTLTHVLRHNRFTLSAEVLPPRNGAEQSAVLGQVAQLVDASAHFLAVTKGAGGSLRGGSLPIAQAIKERFGVPAIAHFTCRDLVAEEVENQLVDHHYFGIRNILALRGDPPDGLPEWRPRAGGYNYAHQLIEQIRRLNEGQYLVRRGGPPSGGQEPADFCIGAAAYPEHPDPQQGLVYFKHKVDAGAHFAITQMVFDADAYGRFLDRCARAGLGIPVLPGTRILRSRAQATKTAEKFGVSVPPGVRRTLPAALQTPEDADATERGLECFLRLVERLRALGAPGVHIFITHTPTACAALTRLTEHPRPPDCRA
ncbi:MAG: methylenetetrahydrofolate reductase [Chloroflexota bacterium]|nr:methylenetetrahydrofolate reductase [Chloroflexota bacterium]